MTDYQVLKKIIHLSTVTINRNKSHIDYIEIDYYFVSFLALLNILELDSGNFETHDNHYRLDENFIKRNNNTRTILLNEIQKQFEKVDDNLVYSLPGNISFDPKTAKDAKKVFFKLKNDLLRKKKLERLNSL